MNKFLQKLFSLRTGVVITALLLLVTTLAGVLSYSGTESYTAQNHYGETIEMYGFGIYSNDSLFKAPIFIGTDITMLFVALPLLIFFFIKYIKLPSTKSKVNLLAMYGLILYYALSIAFGITYNSLHLVYILLVAAAFFIFFYLLFNMQQANCPGHGAAVEYKVNKGLKLFLAISGISLFIAWLPDIVVTWTNGGTLGLIEVYTTEITNVLDMGIISPMIFVTLYLIHKKSVLGFYLLKVLLRTVQILGIMLPIQTICQMGVGVIIPLPALITKVAIFIVLAGLALYFDIILSKSARYGD